MNRWSVSHRHNAEFAAGHFEMYKASIGKTAAWLLIRLDIKYGNAGVSAGHFASRST